MKKGDKARQPKEDKNKEETTKIKLTNSYLYLLPQSQGFKRIMESLDLDDDTSNKIYLLFHQLNDSIERKALCDSVQKLAKKLKADTFLKLMDHPECEKLFEKDSGIEVERITVKLSQVKLSVRDRVELEWLFDFVK